MTLLRDAFRALPVGIKKNPTSLIVAPTKTKERPPVETVGALTSLAEELTKLLLAGRAERPVLQTMRSHVLPIAWHHKTLSHRAPIGAVAAERLLDGAVIAIVVGQSEDVPEFVDRFGRDALFLLLCRKFEEAIDRHEAELLLERCADDEVASFGVEVAPQNHEVVVRLALLPRVVVQSVGDGGLVELTIFLAVLATLLEIPCHAAVRPQCCALTPLCVTPCTEVMNLDTLPHTSGVEYRCNPFRDCNHVVGSYSVLVHDVDRLYPVRNRLRLTFADDVKTCTHRALLV